MRQKKTIEFWPCVDGHTHHQTEQEAIDCEGEFQRLILNEAMTCLNVSWIDGPEMFQHVDAYMDIIPNQENPIEVFIWSECGCDFYIKLCLKSLLAQEVCNLDRHVGDPEGDKMADDLFRKQRDTLKSTFSELRKYLVEMENDIDKYSETLNHID